MDHAETTESEGHAPLNESADGFRVRGNSTRSTASSAAEVGLMMDGNDTVPAMGESLQSTDIDVDYEGEDSMDASVGGGLAPTTAVAPPRGTTTTPSMALGDHVGLLGSGAGATCTSDQPASEASSFAHTDMNVDSPLDVSPSVGLVDEAAGGNETTQLAYGDGDGRLFSPHLLEALPDEGSFEQSHHDLSFDDESADIHSDRASSGDGEHSEPDFIPLQNQNSRQASERSPLENAYGPFIHPEDKTLAEARQRLHVALEQTRLLRSSFAEQAYQRYLCVMKPVPKSLNEIIEPIKSDPTQAGVNIHKESEAIKTEKDLEKKQAQQAGVGLEELAYFGEGLHLVVLPEDEVEENEIDHRQFPHRGPTDLQTGERREEISAAAASTTELVFDRIRRIRAFRMGADVAPGAIHRSVNQITRDPAQCGPSLNESVSPGHVIPPLASSPVPSVDSSDSDASQCHMEESLQHLLTLSPTSEGFRRDGSFTAIQSALIAHGVGMREMKRDLRVNPLRQRIVQPHYFSPSHSYKFLPPLFGPHQLHRLPAADVQMEGDEVHAGSRESIKSVGDQILALVDDKSSKEDNGPKNANLLKMLDEEPGASEIGLLRRMYTVSVKSRTDQRSAAASGENESQGSKGTDQQNKAFRSGPDRSDGPDPGDYDPLLALSVMSALGLVQKKEGNGKSHKGVLDRNPVEVAQSLGLESLLGLEPVSRFFHMNPSPFRGRKRCLIDEHDPTQVAKKTKLQHSISKDGGLKSDVVCLIRGGGRQDEANDIGSKALPKETGEIQKQKKNVGKRQNEAEVPLPGPPQGFASFDPLYSVMSQVSLGDQRSQNVIAAAASRQILQQQLGVPSDPYHTAAIAHQLTMPIGSHLNSTPATNLSDFYLRNGLAGNPDWSVLRATNPAPRPDPPIQHPRLTNSLGLFPGQINLSLPEHDSARTLRDHQNAVAIRAHEAATAAAAARYQAALSSINHQNPLGFPASSQSRQISNETPTASSLRVYNANRWKANELQRKRSSSLSENPPRNGNINSTVSRTNEEKSDRDTSMKRPASAPPSPSSFESKRKTSNGGSSTSLLKEEPCDETSVPERCFVVPAPPNGMHPQCAELISRAKFHEAYLLCQAKSDQSEEHLIKYLLSLRENVPIPKETIAAPLTNKLSMANYQLRLHEIVGSSASAFALRDVIIAVILIWLWVEHADCFTQMNHTGAKKEVEVDPSYKWLINLAIDKSLSALTTFFDSQPSVKMNGANKLTSTGQVASITSQSLWTQVFINSGADTSFPILKELLKLLDSLRTDALKSQTQERVLLAALTSRCGTMSEAFSNSYVSSIVRSGIALGHEHVCEVGQDEECRASTMLPYDFFHDNVGVWEEPCRPNSGYHHAVGGEELKRQAHARSVIQKSMKRLQKTFGLKGGISDGGPYFSLAKVNVISPSTPSAPPPIVRTLSGPLNRKESSGVSVSGPSENVFNPDHDVAHMVWNPHDAANLPYGQHQLLDNNAKKRKFSQLMERNSCDATTSWTLQQRSTQELEWEDVANMFFHGGSTRNIDINYDFGSSDHLGKKKIFAPFVREFDRSVFMTGRDAGNDSSSDEDISDDTIVQRHQEVLDDMKLKLDSALENRKQQSQHRGRKR